MTPETWNLAIHLLPKELANTIYMVFASSLFAFLIGLPLGVILTITQENHLKSNPWIYKTLEFLVNVGRSFPFAILMVALIPVTRAIVGTSLGTTASLVPLTLAAAPFIARIVETSLSKVGKNLIEAAQVMGASPWQIITKVLLPEALPGLIQAMTLTLVNLVGLSAMAGLVGGGGLGQVAIQYGYNRFNTPIMIFTCVLLIVLVQVIQGTGNYLTQKIVNKRGTS